MAQLAHQIPVLDPTPIATPNPISVHPMETYDILSRYKGHLVANGSTQGLFIVLSRLVRLVFNALLLILLGLDLIIVVDHMVNCNSSKTPVDTESKLGNVGDLVSDLTLYQSLAGSLEYLTFTRPNIAYAVTRKGWTTIYDQIRLKMDYIHTTKAELDINLDIALSKQDPLDKLNDLANKKRKHADDIHDYFKANKRLKSSVQYEDHLAGTVLNEPILGPRLDDHARTFSSFLLAEVDKRNLNLLKQMRTIEQLRQ
nr:ribonuclease H-like domain-containing protein [Tanacetum cinerariifolium]